MASAIALLHKENVNLERQLIAYHPFSIFKYKELDYKKTAEIINWMITEFGVSVIILGTWDQNARAAAIIRRVPRHANNLAGKTNLPLLAALLKLSKVSVGVDSFGGHLAAAVGTPTVSLFGPGNYIEWGPYGKQSRIVRKNWSCLPCRMKGCNSSGISRCLDELSVEDVRSEVKYFLKSHLS